MPIHLLLYCHDVKTTQSFYQDILGFKVIQSDQNSCTVQKEDCTLIFTSEDLWNGSPKFTGTIYLFIEDVDAYFEAIKNKAIVLWPVQDMPYGTREFGIKDYDEYHIAFAQKS